MNVLLVEDEVCVALAVRKTLEAVGCAVETESTVAGVKRRMLSGLDPDVVILDWLLADGDAGEVLLAVCGCWPRAKVIVSTAWSPGDIPPIPSKVHWLPKPYAAAVLLDLIAPEENRS